MSVSYKKLWKLLIDKEINKTNIREVTGISPSTIAKMNKNEYVSLEVLDKICTYLECDIGDIMEITNSNNNLK